MATMLEFTRWEEKPRGVGYRRWVITATGLRQVFRTRFFRLLLFLAWLLGAAQAAAGFLLSQSIAPGGWLEQLAANLGPRAEAVVSAFCAYVLLYPDIVVRGLYTALFWFQSDVGLGLSLVALTVIVPRLVTRDRASSALTIYLSRPLTSLDYLVGKFGIVMGVLLVVWTGPLLFGWLLSVLFASDTVFIIHSLDPLLRALLYNAIALAVLGPLALGISAVARSSLNTILLWIGVWIVLGFVAGIPFVPAVVRHASFRHNLDQVKEALFRLDTLLERAQVAMPFVGPPAGEGVHVFFEHLRPDNLTGVVVGLTALVGLSCLVFLRRLKPE